MATSIYTNKYPIPEGFHEILHNFIKETIRAQPKDILDFGIKYFSKLELNQDPTINTKKISMNFPSGETSTINTKSNFYENNTQIQFNQNVENPIHEKISDENSPILTADNNNNNQENIYRPNSRLTTMSVNSTIKNDAREFIGNVLTESKIINSNKIKNEENVEKNNENEENVEKNNENEENNENNNENEENVENNENSNELVENDENNNNENEGVENDDENKNNENNESENNVIINESVNSQNKSNPSYSVTSTQKNDAKEFVEDVLSESKKSF